MSEAAGPPPGPDTVEMQAEVMRYAGRVSGDLAGAMTTVLCALGVRLGLFPSLLAIGPATAAELAGKTGLAERYVREWAYGLAAAGYLEEAEGDRFVLPAGLAPILAEEGSPFSMAPGYGLLPAMTGMLDPVAEAFRTGEGVPDERYPAELHESMEAMRALMCGSRRWRGWRAAE
ncbi:MAG: hypothetical protein GEV11_25185 [Streptosporangiales bacterium]|nr:hypothetical protein [Streptosporangiales bacterium]